MLDMDEKKYLLDCDFKPGSSSLGFFNFGEWGRQEGNVASSLHIILILSQPIFVLTT